MAPSHDAILPGLALARVALQYRPRPLPLFLRIAREQAGYDPPRLAAIMAGVRAYQAAPRPSRRSSARVLATSGRARLLDGSGHGDGVPVVLVPSLINGAEIFDLDDDRSLLRALANRGYRALLVDWGEPTRDERDRTLAGHATELLAPLLDALPAPPLLIGYCLGGILALAAAACRSVRGIALLATPWHFSGYAPPARQAMAALWADARGDVDRLGLMPLDILQAGFWALDPERLLAKFARFGEVAKDPAAVRAFVPLEDWANAGAPLTAAAAHDIFDLLFAADVTGGGAWTVESKAVDPARLAVPLLNIVPEHDRIVPAAASARAGRRLTVPLGHVGLVASRQARALVWEPLADWLDEASPR